jgi:large subunit ribosomal protein L18
MKLLKKKLSKRESLRGLIKGTLERPRLSVFCSNKHIYAQIIDDPNFNTLVACSSVEVEVLDMISIINLRQNENNLSCNKDNLNIANVIGQKIAKRCKQKNITKIIFDRGPYLYHGRVKALAEGARSGGLEF